MNTGNSNIIIVFIEIDGAEHKVGRLAYKDKEIYFVYDSDFLKTGFEISPFILPLQEGKIKCDDKIFEGLFGVFADSLPDGWGRLLVDRHVRKIGKNPRDLSPLDRLLFVGEYGMGALRYEPDKSIGIDSYPQNIVLDEISQFAEDILDSDTDVMVESLLLLGGSSCGARPKINVQINGDKSNIVGNHERLSDGHSHWMIKFPSSGDDKSAGAIEYAYSLMAKAAGIVMPETHLFKTAKSSYFACKRFDRDGDKKIHSHSMAGMVHSDFRTPSLDYDEILTIVREITKNSEQVENAYRLACFNVLAKNKDDHGKNFSFLMSGKTWMFSPAYDLTFSGGPNGEQSTSVMGKGRDIGVEDLLALGDVHLIKNKEQIVVNVVNAISRWKEFAAVADVPEKTLKMIGKALKMAENKDDSMLFGKSDNIRSLDTQARKI
jgi:serine/threonine-protein kinase HipA